MRLETTWIIQSRRGLTRLRWCTLHNPRVQRNSSYVDNTRWVCGPAGVDTGRGGRQIRLNQPSLFSALEYSRKTETLTGGIVPSVGLPRNRTSRRCTSVINVRRPSTASREDDFVGMIMMDDEQMLDDWWWSMIIMDDGAWLSKMDDDICCFLKNWWWMMEHDYLWMMEHDGWW